MSKPAITSFAADIINYSWVRLTWGGSYDYVTIKQSTDNLIYTSISTQNSDTYLDVTGLSQNTLYFFAITPYYSSGTSGSVKKVNVTTPMDLNIIQFYTGIPSSSCVPLYWSGVYYSSVIKYKKSDLCDNYLDTLSSPIVGSNSCVVYNLDADTSYNFYLIPYDVYDISEVSLISTLQTKTDYVPYVGNIYLGSMESTGATVFCDGRFDYLHLQYSSDNETFTTVYSAAVDNSTNYTQSSLSPLTMYYWRAIPYNSGYNFVGYSTTICGETVAGFTTFECTDEANTTATLYWTGSYSSVDIYMSDNSGDYYEVLDTITNVSGGLVSYTYSVTNLSENNSYIFFLVPYYSGVLGTSSELLYVTTDYTADVSVCIASTPGIYSLPVQLNINGYNYPYYEYCQVQISPDNSTFYDASYVYEIPSVEIPYTFTVTSYVDNSGNTQDLLPNYTYYIQATPFSGQDTSGSMATTNCSTLGNILSSSVTIDSDGEIYLEWNGYYSSVYLEYCTDNFTGNNTINTLTVSRDNNTYSTTTTSIITTDYTLSALSTYQTYYYRFIPISYVGDSGSASASIYNATATDYWLSDISTNSATINFSGTYSYVSVLSSTDNSTFSAVDSVVSGNSYVMSVSGEALNYFEIIPYNDLSAAGQQTGSVYTPYITSLSISITDISDIVLTWAGTYDYTIITYSTDKTNYSNLVVDISSGTTTQTINQDTLSSINAQTETYYFKVVPYSFGSSVFYTTQGITSLMVYNPSISSATFLSTTGSNVYYTLKVYWSGTYAGVYIYYDTSSTITTTSSYKKVSVANDGTAYKYTTLTNLSSNTTYYVQILPYNDTDVSGVAYSTISSSTNSLLTGLNLAYNSSGSDSSSVALTWSDNNYTTIKIYDTSGNLYGTYSNSTTSITMSGFSASSTYSFYAKLYDRNSSTETSSSVYGYTLPSSSSLDFTYVTSSSDLPSGYSLSSTAVIFTWTNTGYDYITIYNSTTGSSSTTFSSSSGTTTYLSSSYETVSLAANTEYVYYITLTNAYGSTTTFTETVYTLGTISTLSILDSTDYPLGDKQIPITFTGVFNSIVVNISDGSTSGNISYTTGTGTSSVTYSKMFNSSNSIITQSNTTYYFTIYAVNDEGDTAPASSTVSVKTLGNIHSFYVSSSYGGFGVDSSSIPLYWDGSFSTVALEYANDSAFTQNYSYNYISSSNGGTTRISSLSANTNYYFKLTPLNQPYSDGVDMSGDTTGVMSQYTLGSITNFYVKTSSSTKSSITLAWEGSFNCVNIKQSIDGNTYLDASNIISYHKKEHTISGLYSGTTYYFKLAAVNDMSSVGLYVGPYTGTTKSS